MDSNQNCYTTSQWSKRISYNWRVKMSQRKSKF